MRYIFTLIAVLAFSGILFSQDVTKKSKKGAAENTAVENTVSDQNNRQVTNLPGSDEGGKNSILFFGGYHSYLYGYRDRSYVDTDDQGDFLKATGQYYGVEYSHLGFGKNLPEVENVRIGGLLTYYYRGALPTKNLSSFKTTPAGTIINQDPILPNANDRTQVVSVRVGVFAGLDEKWYELSAGFHANLESEYERERLKYDEFGAEVPSEGRGWMWSSSAMRMNFLARIGVKDNANFTLAIFREDYDPNYGKIMAKIFFPLNDYFKMQVGAFLYPTDAIFIQPVVMYQGVSISPRIGLIINYRDEDFEKVGIFEGLFMSAAATYNW